MGTPDVPDKSTVVPSLRRRDRRGDGIYTGGDARCSTSRRRSGGTTVDLSGASLLLVRLQPVARMPSSRCLTPNKTPLHRPFAMPSSCSSFCLFLSPVLEVREEGDRKREAERWLREERVTFSPPGLSRGFSGFCATQNSREIEVAQQPLNHRRKVGGEKITSSLRAGRARVPILRKYRSPASIRRRAS